MTLSDLHPLDTADLSSQRTISGSFFSGSFLANLKTPSKSLEFVRSYTKGDPVGLIDWRAYARTDQLFIREKRHENKLQILIVLDTAASMFWPDKKIIENPNSKAVIALNMAFHLAYNYLLNYNGVWVQVGEKCYKVRSQDEILKMFSGLSSELASKLSSELSSYELLDLMEQTTVPRNVDLCFVISDGIESLSVQSEVKIKKFFLHTLSSLEVNPNWISKDHYYCDDLFSILKEFSGSFLKKKEFLSKKVEAWKKNLQIDLEKDHWNYAFFTEKTPKIEYFGFLESLYSEANIAF